MGDVIYVKELTYIPAVGEVLRNDISLLYP